MTTRAEKRRILSEQRRNLKEIAGFFTRSIGLGLSTLDLIDDPGDRKFITEVVLPLCQATGSEQRSKLDEYGNSITTNERQINKIINSVKERSLETSALFEKILEDRAKQA